MSTRQKAVYLGMGGMPMAVSMQIEECLRSSFEVVFAGHFTFGDKVDQAHLIELKPDILLTFGPIIVKASLLEVVPIALNIHPGPPEWPGLYSWSFALLHQQSSFGVTAHHIAPRVDAGTIVRVRRFPISSADTAMSLSARALAEAGALASEIVSSLAAGEVPQPSGDRWAPEAMTKRAFLQAMQIDCQDSEAEVDAKVRAFAHSKIPGPYVVVGNRRFWYDPSRDESRFIQ